MTNGILTTLLPALSAVAVVLLCIFYCRCALPERGTAEWIHEAVRRPRFEDAFSRGKITVSDVRLICIACILYAALSAAALLHGGLSDVSSAGGGALTFGSAQPLWSVLSGAFDELFGAEGAAAAVPGIIFGILTVGLSGVFIKMLSKSTSGTFFSLLLLICCGVFFTVCGIDVHASLSALLITAVFFAMYLCVTLGDTAGPFGTLVPMFICGLLFGVGCAVTPQMALSAPGLAAILIFTLIVRGVPGARVSGGARCAMLIGSFIILPAAAYAVTCIACGADFPQEFSRFLTASDAQEMALLKSGLFGLTPDVYFRTAEGGKTVSVSALENPLVCGSAFAAMIILIQRAIKHRDSGAVFVLFAFLTTALPPAFVSGTAADCLIGDVFAVYAVSFVLAALLERKRRGSTAYAAVFTVLAVLVFALFFPVLAGIPVGSDHTALLSWFPDWQF